MTSETVTVQQGQSASGNPYLFQGRRWDSEVSLYYFRNRVYSPVLGRFLQRDPIGVLYRMFEKLGSWELYSCLHSMPLEKRLGLGRNARRYVSICNLYSYVANAPTFWVDSLGLAAEDQSSSDDWSDRRDRYAKKAAQTAAKTALGKGIKAAGGSAAAAGTAGLAAGHYMITMEAGQAAFVGGAKLVTCRRALLQCQESSDDKSAGQRWIDGQIEFFVWNIFAFGWHDYTIRCKMDDTCTVWATCPTKYGEDIWVAEMGPGP